jgi:predicted permease
MITEFGQDVHYAARGLRKRPLLSVAVVATLTLGIGISAGVFTFYDAQYLRPRVDRDFDSMVRVYSAYTTDPIRPGRPGYTTLDDCLAFRDQAKSLRDVAAYADFRAPIGNDDPVDVRTLLVTANFFSLYGLEWPLMGRLLGPEDYSSAADPVVVLSDRLWRDRFDSDPEIVGRVVLFNGRPVTVVGVTPTFAGMVNNARAWFPYTLENYVKRGDGLRRSGDEAWFNVAARLNPGFSRSQASAELKLLASQQDQLHAGRITTLTVTDGSLIQEPGNTLFWGITLLVGALVFLVLIVCLNVATLLLSRAAARRQEITVRLALGAGRMRLARMLLAETLLLATMAGLASLYITYSLPEILMRRVSPANNLDTWSLVPDWRVFVYLSVVTLLAGIMAGLTPAFQSLKVNLSEMLRGRQILPGGARGSRLYGLLIGAQIALSFFLLCGATAFLRAYRQSVTVEPGFETRQVLWTDLFMQNRPAQQRNWGPFYRALTDRIASLPGVQSITYSSRFPFQDSRTTDVRAPGQPMRRVAINRVSPGYFNTLGIEIVSGRPIREGDLPAGKPGCSVVVSQRLARAFWPSENAMGKTLQDSEGNSFEVVGVTREISSTRLGVLDDPMIYEPLDANSLEPAGLFVRFSGDGAALARLVRVGIRDMAPEVSIFRALTIQSWREELIWGLETNMQLLVLVCAMAVILAVIGIYGVVAFAVSQRTRELGVRIALGAQKKDIYRAVLGSSGRPAAAGLVIGLAFTVAAFSRVAPLVRDAEFVLNLQDPMIYVITAILLASVALAAMLVPARRATRLDPMEVLRCE